MIREELLPEKYIEVKNFIPADPTKAESFRIYPLSCTREIYFPASLDKRRTFQWGEYAIRIAYLLLHRLFRWLKEIVRISGTLHPTMFGHTFMPLQLLN